MNGDRVHVVVVSDASRQLLAAHTMANVVGGRAVAEGWEIELDADVYDAITAIDENIDRAISLLCSKNVGHS